MPDIKFLCPRCRQSLQAPADMKGQIIECPTCNAPMRIPVGQPTRHDSTPRTSLPTRTLQWARRNPRRVGAIAAVMCIIALTIVYFAWRTSASPTWLTVSYADLLDRGAIIRTGQTLASALSDEGLRNAVQPFVDHYSELLPTALDFVKGPDKVPCHSVLDFFTQGGSEPAWVAILRGGRIHIVTDDKSRAKVFLLGDDPEQAYSGNYPVIRHCLDMLGVLARGALDVEVFAYQNDYGRSELRLNTKPFSFRAEAFRPRTASLNVDALAAFFAKGPEIQGATLSRDQGLVLYGTEGRRPTLAGQPMDVSDLAVAYRAVFHAGDNEAFISLDPNADPTKATVNFGGFLENTRLGSVVLEADKRFKTITCGLDPNSFRDVRNYTRRHVPSFMTGAERDLLSGDQSVKGQWIGTRFWYYPDAIGVDSDLSWQYAVLTNPRFTADAERSRDDFASPQEFQRKKRTTLSQSIRESIDNVNRNYTQYAEAFPELSELTTVARLMGLCSWLLKAKPTWLDLDDLLAVEIPPCKTEVERTQLMAATCCVHPKGDLPDQDRIAKEAEVIFLSAILDQTVEDYFGSASNVAEYMSSDLDPGSVNREKFAHEASRLFHEHRYGKVREILETKRDVERLASYAARKADVSPPAVVLKYKAEIAADEKALSDMESLIRRMKNQLNKETSTEAYNALVDKHNQLIDEYQRIGRRLDVTIDRYNALDLQAPNVVEIGGGINLEPSKFAIRQNPSSPNLVRFKTLLPAVGVSWTDVGDSRKWTRSDVSVRKPPVARAPASSARITIADRVRHWVKTDTRDGSWRAAVRLDATHSREAAYDAPKAALQVAEFTAGQLKSLIVAHRDAQGRIVFKPGDRRDVLPPQDPPVWHSGK